MSNNISDKIHYCEKAVPGDVNLTEEEENLLDKKGDDLESVCKDVVGSMNSKVFCF